MLIPAIISSQQWSNHGSEVVSSMRLHSDYWLLLPMIWDTPFFKFSRRLMFVKQTLFQHFAHSRFCVWKYPLFREFLDEHAYPKFGRVPGPGPKLTCECILVEVRGRLGVSMGHFVMSIWPELHHRIVRLQRNLGQRTVGPSLICEWILVEIGGCLGVNRGVTSPWSMNIFPPTRRSRTCL